MTTNNEVLNNEVSIKSDIDFYIGENKISFFRDNIEIIICEKQNPESLMKDFNLINSKKTELNSEISKIDYTVENNYSHPKMENYTFITSESFAFFDNSKSLTLIIKKKNLENESKDEKNPFSLVIAFKDNKMIMSMLTFVDRNSCSPGSR